MLDCVAAGWRCCVATRCSAQVEALKRFTAESVRDMPVTAVRIDLYAGSTIIRITIETASAGLEAVAPARHRIDCRPIVFVRHPTPAGGSETILPVPQHASAFLGHGMAGVGRNARQYSRRPHGHAFRCPRRRSSGGLRTRLRSPRPSASPSNMSRGISPRGRTGASAQRRTGALRSRATLHHRAPCGCYRCNVGPRSPIKARTAQVQRRHAHLGRGR